MLLSALLHLMLIVGFPLRILGGKSSAAAFPHQISGSIQLNVELPKNAISEPTKALAAVPLPSEMVVPTPLPPLPVPSAPTPTPTSHADTPTPEVAQKNGDSQKSHQSPQGGLIDVHYYPCSETMPSPQIQEFLILDFPEADKFPDGGKLILDIWISQFGNVDDTSIENTQLPQIFYDHVREAFLNARFSPGYKDGEAVNCLMRIEVNYQDLHLLQPIKPISQSPGNRPLPPTTPPAGTPSVR